MTILRALIILTALGATPQVQAKLEFDTPPHAMVLTSPLADGRTELNTDEIRSFIEKLPTAEPNNTDLHTVFRSLIRDLSHTPCANYASSRMLDELLEKFKVQEAAVEVSERVRETFLPQSQQRCSLAVTLLFLSMELVLHLPDAPLRTSALPLLTKSFRDLLDWIDVNTEAGPLQHDILIYILEMSPSLNSQTRERYMNLLEALAPIAQLRDETLRHKAQIQRSEIAHKRVVRISHLRARSALYLIATAGLASTSTLAPHSEMWLVAASSPLAGLLFDVWTTRKALKSATLPEPSNLAKGVREAISRCEELF